MTIVEQNEQEGQAESADLTFSSMLEAALWYVERGIKVFPVHTVKDGNCTCGNADCDSKGKHPRIEGWRGKASTNPYLLQYWWGVWPDANIGIPCGDDGLVVIDFDIDIPETYHEWAEAHPDLADTLTVQTGSGGYHVYARLPERPQTYIHAGGEVRGSGAYVVGPPSRHVSGAIYKWVDPAAEILAATPDQLPPRSSPEVDPADVQFSTDGTKRPDLSRWNLSDRIRRLIYQPLPVGQRSEADMSVIVALVAAGATDDQIRSVFLHYPIGRAGKYADKGKYADRYLGHSIGKARSYVRAKANERLDVWEQKLEGQDWKGRAGKTDLSVAVELLDLARQ